MQWTPLHSMMSATVVLATSALAAERAQAQGHVNPLVELHSAGKPVFGLYAPANPRGRGGRGGRGAGADATQPVPPPPAQKTPAELATDAVAYSLSDYLFDGAMESAASFDASYGRFVEFMNGMAVALPPPLRLKHPVMVKMHKIGTETAVAATHIGRQLDAGVAGIVFVEVESAEELKAGLTAMRFKSNGGTRPDNVGGAPAYWGMSEANYKAKADLWPLNPTGELVNWTIVETKEGLARVREIAAVKGIGALFPGAGTLRGVFTSTDASGQRVFDEKGWEGALQQVLDACREFKVACGFPANTPEVMEARLKQGFTVFVIGWGENGFKTVEAGRKASGR